MFECLSTQIHLFIRAQSYLFRHPCNFDSFLHLWVLKVFINLFYKLQFKTYYIKSHVWNEDDSLSSWHAYLRGEGKKKHEH